MAILSSKYLNIRLHTDLHPLNLNPFGVLGLYQKGVVLKNIVKKSALN